MSELVNMQGNGQYIRWRLLTTASAAALLLAVYGSGEAKAADQDVDHPTVWIELGGQVESASGQGAAFVPGFLAANPTSSVLQSVTPWQAQRPLSFSFAEEGKITIQPEGSDWVFSAAINYGRSSNFKHVDHQTNRVGHKYNNAGIVTGTTTAANFAETQAHHRESHAILDFLAGKDVGLGLFGGESTSTFSFGVRFAQFASKATFDVRARPDLRIGYFTLGLAKFPIDYFHTYHATGYASRSFRGVGPSISWTGSTPLLGDPKDGEIALDWGANVAILFGRQKAQVRHQETGHAYNGKYQISQDMGYQLTYQVPGGHNSARSVTVPNVGGFAGASFRVENVKVSLGYRADFFFGAIDGGIDTRKSETLGFYGPFASVSVGLGG